MRSLNSSGSKIYREKQSGAGSDQRELLKLLKGIEPGDVVTVTRIDRLVRLTCDLFAIVKRIVDAGAQFRSLAEPWANTAMSTGRLMIAVPGGHVVKNNCTITALKSLTFLESCYVRLDKSLILWRKGWDSNPRSRKRDA
jgi:Resolvase, N terminal domain